MNLQQLISQFPWANHALVRTFANSFSENQWQDFTSAGLDKLVLEDQLEDSYLHQLFKQINEVANYPRVVEGISNGEVTFLQLVDENIKQVMQEVEKERHDYETPFDLPFKSAVTYLNKVGFNEFLLNALFRDLDTEAAIEYSSLIAKLHSAPITKEEKRQLMQDTWKQALFPFSLLCETPNPTPLDVLDYLSKTLTYADYLDKSNANTSSFFRKNPSLKEFEQLKKETITLADFFMCSVLFVLKSPEVENKVEKDSETTSLGL